MLSSMLNSKIFFFRPYSIQEWDMDYMYIYTHLFLVWITDFKKIDILRIDWNLEGICFRVCRIQKYFFLTILHAGVRYGLHIYTHFFLVWITDFEKNQYPQNRLKFGWYMLSSMLNSEIFFFRPYSMQEWDMDYIYIYIYTHFFLVWTTDFEKK